VFGASGIEKFGSGGIVSSPTMFRHGGGLGIMGESGTEGVFPLTRNKRGELSVDATGSSPINLTINVSAPDGRIDKPSMNRLTTQTAMLLQQAARRNG